MASSHDFIFKDIHKKCTYAPHFFNKLNIEIDEKNGLLPVNNLAKSSSSITEKNGLLPGNNIKSRNSSLISCRRSPFSESFQLVKCKMRLCRRLIKVDNFKSHIRECHRQSVRDHIRKTYSEKKIQSNVKTFLKGRKVRKRSYRNPYANNCKRLLLYSRHNRAKRKRFQVEDSSSQTEYESENTFLDSEKGSSTSVICSPIQSQSVEDSFTNDLRYTSENKDTFHYNDVNMEEQKEIEKTEERRMYRGGYIEAGESEEVEEETEEIGEETKETEEETEETGEETEEIRVETGEIGETKKIEEKRETIEQIEEVKKQEEIEVLEDIEELSDCGVKEGSAKIEKKEEIENLKETGNMLDSEKEEENSEEDKNLGEEENSEEEKDSEEEDSEEKDETQSEEEEERVEIKEREEEEEAVEEEEEEESTEESEEDDDEWWYRPGSLTCANSKMSTNWLNNSESGLVSFKAGPLRFNEQLEEPEDLKPCEIMNFKKNLPKTPQKLVCMKSADFSLSDWVCKNKDLGAHMPDLAVNRSISKGISQDVSTSSPPTVNQRNKSNVFHAFNQSAKNNISNSPKSILKHKINSLMNNPSKFGTNIFSALSEEQIGDAQLKSASSPNKNEELFKQPQSSQHSFFLQKPNSSRNNYSRVRKKEAIATPNGDDHKNDSSIDTKKCVSKPLNGIAKNCLSKIPEVTNNGICVHDSVKVLENSCLSNGSIY